MKFILIGCSGRMGKEMISALPEADEIVAGVDILPNDMIKTYSDLSLVTEDYDAVIDFSTCADRTEIFNIIKKRKVLYGCFSTALGAKDEMALGQVAKHAPVIRQKNTSCAVNLMFDMVNLATKLPDAEAAICEWHHKNKKDAPSGTAKQIENILAAGGISYQTQAFRVDGQMGTHAVQFFMDGEILEVKHTATSRSIFARGAYNSMHWLAKQRCGLYDRPKL